jgi:hypothetical protein
MLRLVDGLVDVAANLRVMLNPRGYLLDVAKDLKRRKSNK